MVIEKIVTDEGTIYAINISDEGMRQYLESLGVDLVSIVKTEIQKQLLNFEKQRLQEILNQYGYISLGDTQFYASQNDTEAQGLLSWYEKYDDLIWQYIDNDLQTLATTDELLALDIRQVEEQIYQNSITASPLP